MPIGAAGAASPAIPASAVLQRARKRYPDLHPVEKRLGNGPAVYYKSDGLEGYLGIIAARSAPFCADCNRLRLTSTGRLQTCLDHAETADLRASVRAGADTGEIAQQIYEAAARKPAAHDFFRPDLRGPERHMNEIGG